VGPEASTHTGTPSDEQLWAIFTRASRKPLRPP
jgi:hypothetical protein